MKKEWIQKNISPNILLLSGAAVIIAFIFQKNIFIKASQAGIFIFLTFISGNKIKILNSIFLLIFIVIFNLLSPAGKVIFYISIFPVTELSLVNGLIKALTFIGLFYISKVFISRDINIPGSFGRIISRTFSYLNDLTKEKIENIREPVKSLDKVLLKVYYNPGEQKTRRFVKTSMAGAIFIIVIIVLNWIVLML